MLNNYLYDFLSHFNVQRYNKSSHCSINTNYFCLSEWKTKTSNYDTIGQPMTRAVKRQKSRFLC